MQDMASYCKLHHNQRTLTLTLPDSTSCYTRCEGVPFQTEDVAEELEITDQTPIIQCPHGVCGYKERVSYCAEKTHSTYLMRNTYRRATGVCKCKC